VGAAAYLYVGSHITLPGVNLSRLMDFWERNGGGGLLGLYELMTSGGLQRGAVVALGIMPYLTARAYLWLSRFVVNDADWTRSRKVTRYLTAALALAQSVGFAAFLRKIPGVVTSPGSFMTTTILTLTAASLVTMWFGEKLTQDDDADEIDPPSALDEDSALRQEISAGSVAGAKESSAIPPPSERVHR
jgi:preprotein translocase subunit SecY